MYSQTEREERGQGQTQLKLATKARTWTKRGITRYTTDSNVEQKLILSSQQIQVTQLRSMWTQ